MTGEILRDMLGECPYSGTTYLPQQSNDVITNHKMDAVIAALKEAEY